MKISENYNFSYECKKEISNYYQENSSELIYLFSGFLNNSSEIIMNQNKIEFEFITSYIDVIKLFKSFFNENEITIFISNKKTLKYNNTKYKVLISPNEDIAQKLLQLILEKKNKKQTQAYLAGVFLSSGSVANPITGNNHLEFRISNNNTLGEVKKSLAKFGISYKENYYRNKNVIYVKRLQEISDLLKIFNAGVNMMLLEEYRISSDIVNTLQRLNNLDISNLAKATKSNNELNSLILEIKKTKEYYLLPDNIKKYCDIKLKYPTLTMSELLIEVNNVFEKPVTKSWINHTNIRLKKMAK